MKTVLVLAALMVGGMAMAEGTAAPTAPAAATAAAPAAAPAKKLSKKEAAAHCRKEHKGKEAEIKECVKAATM